MQCVHPMTHDAIHLGLGTSAGYRRVFLDKTFLRRGQGCRASASTGVLSKCPSASPAECDSEERAQNTTSQIHYQPGLQQDHNCDFELCFKVSNDFSNVVAAWNAAVSIAKDVIAEYGR